MTISFLTFPISRFTCSTVSPSLFPSHLIDSMSARMLFIAVCMSTFMTVVGSIGVATPCGLVSSVCGSIGRALSGVWRLYLTYYTPPGGDLYCSPCRLYEPTYRSSPHIPREEVMWQAEEEVYSDNLLRRLSE